jgi:hypothetical protein
MVLSAEDFTQEQEYHRRKQRRHNRHLHGTGTVRGLEVTVDGDGAAGSSVTVSAGVAIAPDGEQLVVDDPLTQPLPSDAARLYVALTLVDRPTAFVPAPGDAGDAEEKHASRIDEVVELHLLPEVTSAHHAVARVELADDRWRIDPTFEPPTPGRQQ